MTEKKREPGRRSTGELERLLTEIVVADKRSTEPFIKVFSAIGENVTKLDLGQLVGVFEVDEQSEDAAYIVNFLASVAKKEYFSNPRRGAIESFEAALHKVNVALAELVKHGNVAWLGKLHGALAVLEKNNCHFSVTGEASLLLLRQGAMTDISEGLASPEAQSHPLKTFVEVSSGRLSSDDTLLLATPELRALFSLENLAKQAERMGNDGFLRFLRTALVNELDMAAVIAIQIGAEKKVAPAPRRSPAKAKAPESSLLTNVFSQAAFQKPPLEKEDFLETAPPAHSSPEEYIDEKTGHIYVQGGIIEESSPRQAMWESLEGAVESIRRSLAAALVRLRKTFRRSSKSLGFALEQGSAESRRALRSAARRTRHRYDTWQHERDLARQLRAAEAEARAQEALDEAPRAVPPGDSAPDRASAAPAVPVVSLSGENEAPAPRLAAHTPARRTLRSKLSRFYAQDNAERDTFLPDPSLPETGKASPWPSASLRALWGKGTGLPLGIRSALRGRPRPSLGTAPDGPRSLLSYGWLALGGLLLAALLAWFWIRGEEEQPAADLAPVQNIAPTPAPSAENGARLASDKAFTVAGGLRGLAIIGNSVYAATPRSIVDVESGTAYAAPVSGEIRALAAMPDLQLLFLLTTEDKLYAWSPLSKEWTENALPLPADANVQDIGTYLTYLYALDSQNDQIYRFPRVEGGFGEPVSWLRTPVTLEDAAFMAVNETIMLAPAPGTLAAYFQGREAGRFETAGPIRALASPDGSATVYTLSATGNELSLWTLDREFVKSYPLESSQEREFLAGDPESGRLYIGDEDGTVTRYQNVRP